MALGLIPDEIFLTIHRGANFKRAFTVGTPGVTVDFEASYSSASMVVRASQESDTVLFEADDYLSFDGTTLEIDIPASVTDDLDWSKGWFHIRLIDEANNVDVLAHGPIYTTRIHP